MTACNILIIDPDSPTRESLVEAIKGDEYAAFGVESLERADEVLQALKISVVIVHETLPDGDGTQWGARLAGSSPDTVVLLTRDNGWDKAGLNAVHDGIHGVLRRSIDAPELLERIGSELAARRRRTTRTSGNGGGNDVTHWVHHERAITHELANILAPIVGISDLLHRKLDGHDAHGLAPLVRTLRERSMKARDFVAILRDIRALESGTHAVYRRAVDIVPLVRSAIQNKASEHAHSTTSIEAAINADCAVVAVDADLINKVLLNTLQHAIERRSGEPAPQHRTVTVRVDDYGENYAIKVTNDNAGGTSNGPSHTNIEDEHARLVVALHGGTFESHDHSAGVTITLPKAEK